MPADTKTELSKIRRYFRVIDKSLFTISGSLDYDRITDAIIRLSNAITHYPDDTEEIWYIGESGDCDMADLIVGAFWHYTEYHSGQWSKGYAALSALGQVFDPGMTMPERDNEAYLALGELA